MTTLVTHHDRAGLLAGAMIEHGKSRLFAEWTWDKRSCSTEGRFVMKGPSGLHSLLIIATDAERLDAHWRNFTAHPLNR